MGFQPPAKSHKIFQVGDIVVAVEGIKWCRTDEYIDIRSATKDTCELEILRYDPFSQSFVTIQARLVPGEPKVKIRDLKESKRR